MNTMSELQKAPQNVLVIAPKSIPSAAKEAKRVASFLEKIGISSQAANFSESKSVKALQAGDFDLVITIGGDGTVLRAGHLCAPHDIPLLAIDMGRFGFLIEVDPDEWAALLPRLVSGEFWYERRMLLNVTLIRDGNVIHESEAINEAMIGRGSVVRPVHVRASLDNRTLTTYVADGLIVSTPTGSTAYALAAGGPILPPDLRNLLIIPVAPHLSVDRAIVLAAGATVGVELLKGDEPVLSIDGREPVSLQLGDKIEVAASEHSLRFLRFQDAGYFYQRLISIMDNNPATQKKNND
jgi:NAD+ kinase